MTLVAIVFWLSAALIVYTHAGYPLVLRALLALRRHPVETWPGLAEDDPPLRPADGGVSAALPPAPPSGTVVSPAPDASASAATPSVSLIVPAYDEEEVIAAKVANALGLDYPRERLQVIVASDGSTDATADRARAAGADLVLELSPGGKVAALNAAAERATGELLAFSDANSAWSPDALRRLVAPFADATVGYVCGQVRFLDAGGDNLEGAYWRYEMAVRRMESALAGITAGNGAIYAVRRSAYLPLAPSGSHDLSFPFELAKRGLRSLYVPAARAEEKMVPTMEGEFARKRRMMVGLWDIVVGEGMLRPRGYPPLFAFELASHRLLRYLSPALHLGVLATNVALLGHGTIYLVTFLAQLALIAAALAARRYPLAPLRVARYYVMTTASIAAGLWDRWRHGASGRWEKAEGTR
jgi:cellulose synthase/poly-beta-1,6-N-acetylglucosamine synthase-like glycosyltransferase